MQEIDHLHRQRQRWQARRHLPARLGCRLPGRHELPGLPLRCRRHAAVRRRSSPTSQAALTDGRHDGRSGGPQRPRYAEANKLIKAARPDDPGRAWRLGDGVSGRRAGRARRPLGSELLVVMTPGDRQTSSCSCRAAEPGGLYCADETDGEALRACEQIGESLLRLQGRRHRRRARPSPPSASRTPTSRSGPARSATA